MKAFQFFDFKEFEHSCLFESNEFVWQVLGENLKAYLEEICKGEIKGQVSNQAYLENEECIFIDEGTIVEAQAYIRGPAYIGKNCQIRQGAYIRGDILVGDRCIIGHATEIKSSIMLNDAKAAHFAYVGDSILGNHVNLGAGTKLANLKVTPGSVQLLIDNKKIDSGLRKFGAILGDHVETGCNSVTSPGTIVGKGSIIYPCAIARGVYSENTILKVKRENFETVIKENKSA
ncbi:MAG: glucose-1-phosphate thymidylyltransferase [Pseudomonadota bacterium]